MGYFSNSVKVEWPEGAKRNMVLLEDIEFIDSDHVTWKAPKGSIIDGASIPRFLWRATGSPFVGNYRRASVIHDVYCVTKSRPHEEVHQMFEEAMEADEVPKWKRKLMANAVKWFGPKW